jgi:hypothetical protein
MNQKNYLILDNEFFKYCELNKIHDVQKFAQDIFQKGFTIIKYGETPMGFSSEKIVEKEVIKEVPVEKVVEKIVEIIKEVPVEKIVEVIKEVPVEMKGDTQVIIKEIIKEVPVEKIVEVTKEVFNNEEILRLQEENQKLKSELEKITTSLESFGKRGKLMRDSNLSSLYDE